jgi:hypothetical protein
MFKKFAQIAGDPASIAILRDQQPSMVEVLVLLIPIPIA